MNHRIDPLEAHNDTLMERLERALIAGRLNRRGFIRAATAAGFGSLGLSALADELDIEALLLEMERLHNHIADLGALCNDVGHSVLNAHALRIRETLLRLNAHTIREAMA